MTDTRTSRRCMSCLRVGTHASTCPDPRFSVPYKPPVVIPGPEAYRLEDTYVISQDVTAIQAEARVLGYLREDTLAGGLSWTGVMDAIDKGPQSHRAGRNDRGPIPVWPVVLVFCGLVLMALAMVGLGFAPAIHEALTR